MVQLERPLVRRFSQFFEYGAGSTVSVEDIAERLGESAEVMEADVYDGDVAVVKLVEGEDGVAEQDSGVKVLFFEDKVMFDEGPPRDGLESRLPAFREEFEEVVADAGVVVSPVRWQLVVACHYDVGMKEGGDEELRSLVEDEGFGSNVDSNPDDSTQMWLDVSADEFDEPVSLRFNSMMVQLVFKDVPVNGFDASMLESTVEDMVQGVNRELAKFE